MAGEAHLVLGFNGHDTIHFKTSKLKKVFYARVFKVTSIQYIALPPSS